MFQLARVGHVIARLVLSQDFHQRAQLQPPLVLGHPVTEEHKQQGSVNQDFYLTVRSCGQYFREVLQLGSSK